MEELKTKLEKINHEQWKKGKTYADWQKQRYAVRVEKYEKRVPKEVEANRYNSDKSED